MRLELLSTIKDHATFLDLTCGVFLTTSPCLHLIMLSVLMPFPIIFAPKIFVA